MQAFLYIGAVLAAVFGLTISSNPKPVIPANQAVQPAAIEIDIASSPHFLQEEKAEFEVKTIQEREESPKKATPSSNTQLSNDDYYTNVDGERVHSPAYTPDDSIPPGASARCRDGTYSFSKNRRGTCSHHGGVANWL